VARIGGKGRVKERTILLIVLLGILLVGAGLWAGSNVNFMPIAASTRAREVDQLARVMFGIATVVFLLVEGALIYAVIRFRRRGDQDGEGAAYHGNNMLELVWTAIPAVVVVFLGIYAYRVLAAIEKPADDELVVEVVARQFIWEFRYPEYGKTSLELHLPVDQPVRFEITSADVIHSFWIPEFRAKRDATPGQIAELRVTPTRLGTYPIRCAELCGAGHAAMTSQVIVESAADFQAWVSGAPRPAAQATPGEPALEVDGKSVFQTYGCGACHALADAGTTGVVGPALDELPGVAGSRVEGMDAELYVRESILDPNAFIVPGFPADVMPEIYRETIPPEALEALVQYLLGK
jgi:cytochrome c oxidase subunit 2